MEPVKMKYPFEVPFEEVQADPDQYVTAVFSGLESEFLTMPKGAGFIDYPVFEQGYEALKQATGGFRNLAPETVQGCVLSNPISLIVIRTMLGFTPPEWAYVASQHAKIDVPQNFVRSLDRKVRMAPLAPLKANGATAARLKALAEVACALLTAGVPRTLTGCIVSTRQIPGREWTVSGPWLIWERLMPCFCMSDFSAGPLPGIVTQ
jgi:hypothetical protein